MTRILFAGVGNVLRGDDGFGVRLAQLLQREALPENVTVLEVGTSGLSLVQELMTGYDACIIADATDRGAVPGALFLLQPEPQSLPQNLESLHAELVDMHYAEPSRALLLAQALGVLPHQVYILACQPERVEDFEEQLSPALRRALSPAVEMTLKLLHKLAPAERTAGNY